MSWSKKCRSLAAFGWYFDNPIFVFTLCHSILDLLYAREAFSKTVTTVKSLSTNRLVVEYSNLYGSSKRKAKKDFRKQADVTKTYFLTDTLRFKPPLKTTKTRRCKREPKTFKLLRTFS